MTIEEVHEYNKTHAIASISYPAVASPDAAVEMRRWIEYWLGLAYEAGYKAAKEGKL